MGISTAGIGSGLDVESIITKLMQVEAQPLATFDTKTKSYQAKLTAFGSLSGAISGFQSSLSSLTSVSSFQSVTALSTDTDVMVGAATSKAVPGNYKVDITQIAQAQTLASSGRADTTSAVGLGLSTTVSFQLGSISGGSFGSSGGVLPASVASSGIVNGALTINGSAIATSSDTRSAKALAEAINAKNGDSGVSATAQPASTGQLFGTTGAPSFASIDTRGGGTYSLAVGGVQIATQGANLAAGAGVTADAIDLALTGPNSTTAALAAANITFTGKAADGTLAFFTSDGANLAVTETVTAPAVPDALFPNAVTGGIGKGTGTLNSGSSVNFSGSVTLASSGAEPITIAGANPALAGLTAGLSGSYQGATFNQDPNQVSGTVVIDSKNNSLQGIRDAINNAKLGVTATIVSDGSATPNHLVLSSTQTGAKSSIRIALAGTGGGAPDAALAGLLAYDPAGVQNMKQNAAAQSTLLNVNGIPVTSETNSVTDAIQGVTLTIGTTGKANLSVAQDTKAIKTGVNAFVKAYNDLNNAIKKVSGYDADTKTAGALLGDATVRNLQAGLRKQLSTGITGLNDGALTSLSQVGIAFGKDGTLSLDSGKLDKAIADHLPDIAALFAAVGKASDSLVSFSSSTSKTVPGDYALYINEMATQGTLSSDSMIGTSTIITPNTKWTVSLNQTDPATANRTAVVSLAAGTYTPAQLSTLIQSAINGATGFAANGLAASASIDKDGKLNVASAQYGSISKIAISALSGSTVSDVFGPSTLADGHDIAGTLGGQAATGSGQFLTGLKGSAAEGLKIEVTGGTKGDRGTVGFSQGYAYQINNLAASFLGSDGMLAGRTDGLNATIKNITKQRDAFSERLVDIEKRYRAQYTALDTAIASMNSTQTFLTQQLAALTAQTN